MKKYLFAVCFVFFAATVGAQSMRDAITFSENNYYGTARSVALGNAVTALGGDNGMFGINPAGSAVSAYSQFSFTPGLSISTVNSAFRPGDDGYGPYNRNNVTKFTVPNIGLQFHLDMGRERGIRSMSFGIAANTTNKHLSYQSAGGVNGFSSMYGAFAERANFEKMDPDVFYNWRDPWYDTNYSWNPLSAYGANMISPNDRDYYLGATQLPDGSLPGELMQRSTRESFGSKTDIEINYAVNIEDKFYIGLNLGVPVQRYTYYEDFSEAAMEPMDFPISLVDAKGQPHDTYFQSALYRWSYDANIDGVYGKLGVIWLPTKWLRLGAAFKTPTAYTITERWSNRVTSSFEDKAVSESCGPSTGGEYRYRLRSPYEINVGVAATLGTIGLLSVDYEMNDFSIMQYREIRQNATGPGTYFYEINKGMKNFAGVSHSVRVGLEFNATQNISLRGGFNMQTTPERRYRDNFGAPVYVEDYLAAFEDFESGLRVLDRSSRSYLNETRFGYSFGLGYRSNGSFFADIAARCTQYPQQIFACYADYGEEILFSSPVVSSFRSLWDVLLTIGWRF